MKWVKEFYTVQEAAELLKVKPKTVLEWIKSGKIKAGKLSGKYYRIYEDQLLEFMKNNNFFN